MTKPLAVVLSAVLGLLAITMHASFIVAVVASPSEAWSGRLLGAALVAGNVLLLGTIVWVFWLRRLLSRSDGSGQKPAPRSPSAALPPRRSALLIWYWVGVTAVCGLSAYSIFFTENERPWSLLGPVSWLLLGFGFTFQAWLATRDNVVEEPMIQHGADERFF